MTNDSRRKELLQEIEKILVTDNWMDSDFADFILAREDALLARIEEPLKKYKENRIAKLKYDGVEDEIPWRMFQDEVAIDSALSTIQEAKGKI